MSIINDSRKGFTLVEIMIAVVIIGLLAAMAIPAFSKVNQSSKAKTCVNNLRQIAGAKDQYFLEYGGEPNVPLDTLIEPDGYIKATPICPAGGNYTNPLPPDVNPECDSGDTGHVFPAT